MVSGFQGFRGFAVSIFRSSQGFRQNCLGLQGFQGFQGFRVFGV